MGDKHHKNISLNIKDIVATNYLDDEIAKGQLQKIIFDFQTSQKVVIKTIPQNAEIIDFFIYTGDFFEWSPLAIINDAWYLLLDKRNYLDIF